MEYQNIANGIIDIVFPENGQLRSRKVVKRSNARNTGKYPSFKMQRMMQWESIHEGNAMRILDASPNVISYGEQPCVIIYKLNGMQHRHYPDFLVVKSHGREFLEIKTEVDANQPDIAERTAFLQKALPGYGYNYSVVLAETLSNQPRLDNINRVIKLGRQAISILDQEQIRQLFKSQSEFTWGMIEQQSPESIRIVSRLILQGKLSIDFNQPISAATLIRSNFNG